MPSNSSPSKSRVKLTTNTMASNNVAGKKLSGSSVAKPKTKAKANPFVKQNMVESHLKASTPEDVWRMHQYQDMSIIGKQQKALELCMLFTQMLRDKRFGQALEVAEQILIIEPNNKLINENIDMLRDFAPSSSDDDDDSGSEEDGPEIQELDDSNVSGDNHKSSESNVNFQSNFGSGNFQLPGTNQGYPLSMPEEQQIIN